MRTKTDSLFSFKPSWPHKLEKATRWVLRLATYLILVAASYLFLHIAIRGAGAVLTPHAPFIDTTFLTQKPQTLHVFEPRETREAIRVARTRINLLRAAEESPEGELAAQISQLERLESQSEANRIVLSDTEYREQGGIPPEGDYLHESYAYSGGGIGPAIAGTLFLVGGSIVIALGLGLVSAIYLSEYGRPGRTLHAVRISVLNLAGVPSIVFGLFGFGLFVLFFGWGVSLLAGWFTLALMALPVIIAASEESMRAVPHGYREGALALGATRWTSIRTNVLPYALPGILTSAIMGVARVAGETAPIMFTAAYALRDQLPWEGLEHWHDFFFQGVMALPYHIYVVSTKIPQNEHTERMQYGSAFVFLVIVGFFALSSVLLRAHLRRKYDW